ncbi:hypothetical protein CC80DRAFT_563736 [Byssothecium circinans]|uniref:Uncharacterized protein n=1 Tax=Byssothecium circinans TaxID=147558 RepID=A0A6A5TW77_9PLEO|nr:hypothetical protein CC80DRAFT_563736 [Byssothecium circinans]
MAPCTTDSPAYIMPVIAINQQIKATTLGHKCSAETMETFLQKHLGKAAFDNLVRLGLIRYNMEKAEWVVKVQDEYRKNLAAGTVPADCLKQMTTDVEQMNTPRAPGQRAPSYRINATETNAPAHAQASNSGPVTSVPQPQPAISSQLPVQAPPPVTHPVLPAFTQRPANTSQAQDWSMDPARDSPPLSPSSSPPLGLSSTPPPSPFSYPPPGLFSSPGLPPAPAPSPQTQPQPQTEISLPSPPSLNPTPPSQAFSQALRETLYALRRQAELYVGLRPTNPSNEQDQQDSDTLYRTPYPAMAYNVEVRDAICYLLIYEVGDDLPRGEGTEHERLWMMVYSLVHTAVEWEEGVDSTAAAWESVNEVFPQFPQFPGIDGQWASEVEALEVQDVDVRDVESWMGFGGDAIKI